MKVTEVTDEEERESTISFMEVLQWGSDSRNQAKGKNPALMAFVNQIQVISPLERKGPNANDRDCL